MDRTIEIRRAVTHLYFDLRANCELGGVSPRGSSTDTPSGTLCDHLLVHIAVQEGDVR